MEPEDTAIGNTTTAHHPPPASSSARNDNIATDAAPHRSGALATAIPQGNDDAAAAAAAAVGEATPSHFPFQPRALVNDLEHHAYVEATSLPQPPQDLVTRNDDFHTGATLDEAEPGYTHLNTSSLASSSHSADVYDYGDDQTQQPVQQAQLAEEQHLEADEIDSDSALGSDTESTTTSLSESIYQYRKEHGRTYHAYKDGKYIFPNDEREADRLDLQHHLFRITYGNHLFFAPLRDPKRAIDVGTGTGIWAVDFADEFPECQVMGIDLSPGQPTLVPPNLKFIIDDAEDLWIYPQQFDFIHLRLMAGCFSDWQNLFRQAYQNLEPGGWLEIQDYGLPVKSADDTHLGTDLLRWGELLCEAARQLGRPMGSDVSDRYVAWMEEAGFVDIEQRMFMWPSNAWPKDPFMKELGRWNQINILDGLEGFCLALLTRGLGWRKEEVDVFVARVARDLRDRKIHAYFPMPVTFGRKPFPHEVGFH